MPLEPMVAETLGFRTDHLALIALAIFPAKIQPIGIFRLIGESWPLVVHKIELLVVKYLDRHGK